MAAPETVTDSICYMCTTSCPNKIHVNHGRAVKMEMVNRKVAHHPEALQDKGECQQPCQVSRG